jgi:hypothetical protein
MKTVFSIILAAVFLAAIGGAALAQAPVDTAVGASGATGQGTITSTAALIRDIPSGGHFRLSLMVSNTGSSTLWWGFNGTVTTTTGKQLLPGQTLTLDRSVTQIWGICASGQTTTFDFAEEYR